MLDLLNFAKFVNFKRQETSSSLDLRTNSNVPICKAASDNKKPALQPGIWDLLMCNGMQKEAVLQTNRNLYWWEPYMNSDAVNNMVDLGRQALDSYGFGVS